MMQRFRAIPVGPSLLAFTLLIACVQGGDWPTFAHDAGRTGCTDEPIGKSLHRQWTYVPVHAPRPAWPDPIREAHLMDFDYCCPVAVAGGIVCFGSSS